jgi:hypothetical protein
LGFYCQKTKEEKKSHGMFSGEISINCMGFLSVFGALVRNAIIMIKCRDFFEDTIWLGWLVDRENLKNRYFWVIPDILHKITAMTSKLFILEK